MLKNKIEKSLTHFKTNFLNIPTPLWGGGVLFITALLSQITYWGNPVPFIDPQYYLFGGGQILQGKVPYVDFWDCKPVGLFLLFSIIRLFDPFQYYALPIISSLFLFIGALGLYKIASLFTQKIPAFCIGFLYILLNTLESACTDGQAEQFFVPITIWAITLFFLRGKTEQQSTINNQQSQVSSLQAVFQCFLWALLLK